MSAKTALLRQQFDWAAGARLQPDSRGYLASYKLNLFQPLSPDAHSAFMQGSGSELLPTDRRPAKMAALHSSSALAVNVFDYWSGKSLAPIAVALDIEQSPAHLRFEAQFPTGLGGTPPHLDLEFKYADGRILGVESKFSEWLTPKLPRKDRFKPKYFPAGKSLWSQLGLHNAQRLAHAVQTQEESFRYLDIAQLLKHMLGLASAAQGKSSLYYLYYDWPGPESSIHSAEIESFASLIGNDMRFHWASYQQIFRRIRIALGQEHGRYIEYITRRYLQNAV